jgi:hypothetical protein
MMRQGDAPAALPMYLLMWRLRGLPMYGVNARAAATALGMDESVTIAALEALFDGSGSVVA